MTATIKCKDENKKRVYENASIAYIDNGATKFVNITDSYKWTDSYRIEDIEFLEVK